MEQNEYRFVIFAVGVIVMYEFQELAHLLFRNSLSGLAVVDYHTGKLEAEGVLDENVIIDRHLKCRSQHTAHSLDGTVASAVTLHLDKEQLCIRGLDGSDLSAAEFLLFRRFTTKL